MQPCEKPLPMERPAAFFCLVLAAGLIIGERFPGHLGHLLSGALPAGIGLLFLKAGHPRALLATLGVFLLLGYASIQPWVAPQLPTDHIKFRADSPRGVVTGRVAGLPGRYRGRTRLLLDVETFNQKRASGTLRLTVVGRVPDIGAGDRLQFRARIKSIRNFNNPGAFDYRRYLTFQKIWASAWVSADRIRILDKDPDFRLSDTFARVRAALSGWMAGALPGRTGGIMAALVTGDRSGIPPQSRQQFNRLGIGHLLAISGLHIGIIATVSFGCLSWLCRRVAWLVTTGRARPAAAGLTLIPVAAYGLIAGMSPSTQRAVIMVAAFLAAIILDRDQDPLNTLAAAALAIMVIHPPALFSISFQLSFTAVFTIIYGLARLPERLLKPLAASEENWLPAKIADTLAGFFWVSLFALLGTLPLAMHYFNQVSYVGILTNFIFIPLVGFVTVPLALAATGLYPLSGLLADCLLQAAGVVLARALALADQLAAYPWISARTVTLSWFEVVCVFGLTFLGLRLFKPAHRPAGSRPGDFEADRRLAWIGLAAVVLLLSGDAAYWLNRRFWHRDLRVTCIDVRQGTAVLLEFPGGATMLVDGGGYADNSVFDMGARVVAPLLWRRKILTVDTLVLSHPNSDHLNGLLFIAENFNVGEIWTNAEPADTAGYRRLTEIAREKQIPWPDYGDLPRAVNIGGARVSRLYPPDDFLSRGPGAPARNVNDNSLVLRVVQDGVAFLFTGDIMRRAENELVRQAGSRLASSVLLVPHHGSNSSSTAGFLRRVKPDIAVISVGQGNWYGFPHKAVLARLRAIGSRIYRTDRQGAIMLSTQGGRLHIETTGGQDFQTVP